MLSNKKHDIYVSSAAVADNAGPSAAVVSGQFYGMYAQPQNRNYGDVHAFLHVPTHKYLATLPDHYIASRTSTRPYLKGFKEVYRITPSDASVWWHRRITFACKGNPFFKQGDSNGLINTVGAESSPPTSVSSRPFRDLSNEVSGQYQQAYDKLMNYLYDGVFTTDWRDPFTAATDKTRLTILSDRFQRIVSGNQTPSPVHRKHYTPINKTVQYDDEQNGLLMSSNPISTDAKPGLGDIYVFDLFGCPAPITSGAAPGASTLLVSSTSTLYWHEK